MVNFVVPQIIEWLKAHWFLLAAIVTFSSALASDHQKIKTLEEAIKNQTQLTKELSDLKAQAARTDERTVMIINLLVEQKKVNETLLRRK